MLAIEAVTTTGATAALCQSVGLARATLYRRRQPARSSTPTPRAASSRALGPAERQAVLDVLHSERFVDQSPAEVQATLLEEQTYLCSTRTMYRILDAAEEVRERRAQARHPAYAKPELVATAPNQIWSWDITKLKGPIPYLYYSLYVILDLFSRYVVGWMVAAHENAHLAQRLIEATCRKQHIGPQQLTIHADRGAPMRSKLVALLFSDLGIEASHSRPRVSNDNPFSEAQFRTVKYRPDFPDRFGSIEHARAIGHDLFAWYNDAHHHSGLSYLTPADVHYGRAATILEVRHHTRLAAYAAHPERFVQGPPRGETLPTAVWINPPAKVPGEDAPGTTIVTPADPQHGGHKQTATASRRPGPLPDRARGGASVNSETGCLTDVDTARVDVVLAHPAGTNHTGRHCWTSVILRDSTCARTKCNGSGWNGGGLVLRPRPLVRRRRAPRGQRGSLGIPQCRSCAHCIMSRGMTRELTVVSQRTASRGPRWADVKHVRERSAPQLGAQRLVFTVSQETGAEGGTRTPMTLRSLAPEASASADSATSAGGEQSP